MASATANIYNFAIIRVSPDPRRGELVNIGIAVFNRYDIDVRILPSLAKVHALHEDLDLSQLFGLPEKINKLGLPRLSPLETHEALRQIGMVELSELGRFQAHDKEQYEGAITNLMDRLVRPTSAPRERGTVTSN